MTGFAAALSHAAAPSAAMKTQRCERPLDHRPHAPYVRPGSDADFACPGGPLPPVDAVLFDLAVMAA